MSNRCPAQIWIGGKVSKTAKLFPADDNDVTILQGLIAALSEDGASHEYGDAEIDADCTDLAPHMNDDGLLHLRHDQAVNGEFQETEQFCIDNDIPFDRNSDHYCEYDGENAHWRPGMNAPQVTYADSRGKEIVDGETVRQAIKSLVEHHLFSCGKLAVSARQTALGLLRDACPDLPPPLEKFEIVS